MPNVVKGSKQRRMVVVPHRPFRRLILPALACAGVLAAATAAYLYGHNKGQRGWTAAAEELADLNREVGLLREENARLQRELAIMERASLMDEQAAEELQSTMAEQREQIAQLEEAALHYRQVVAEETEATGLVIGDLSLDPAAEPGRYRYKLVMRQQDADGDTFLEGHVSISLVGRRGTEEVVLPLNELTGTAAESSETAGADIELRFKFFQNIEGELALPASFTPEKLRISAVSTEPVAKEVNEEIGWALALEE